MKKRPLVLRLIACTLAVFLLTGCTQEGIMSKLGNYLPEVKKNETISESSKWINSSIDGAIDADTPTNVKDDFYTAVNKDFLLEPMDGEEAINAFTPVQNAFQEQYVSMFFLDPEDTTGADPEIMAPEKLQHIQSLVHTLLEFGIDEEGRNAAGTQPLEPFLAAIDRISSLEDLTAYFRNDNGDNLFGFQLAPFGVLPPYTEKGGNRYTVLFTPNALLSLKRPSKYQDAAGSGYGYDSYNRALLSRLGYSDQEIQLLLTRCYRFEKKLARCLDDDEKDVAYYTNNDSTFDRAGLEALAGNYPIGTILDAYGFGGSETFTVPLPIQLETIGSLYTQKNLEDIKAYLTVHTVLQSVSLLDEETYNLSQEYIRQISGDAPETEEGDIIQTDADDTQAEVETLPAEDEADQSEEAAAQTATLVSVLPRFVNPYLYDAIQQMYAARYCTAEQKEQVTEMARKLQAAFRTALEKADWMGEETRAEALNKLNNMGLHILYPDHLIDYTSLSFDGCKNMLDAMARITEFQMGQQSALINQPVDRSNWDLTALPTISINAFYSPTDNSINICAGILADGKFFDPDGPEETNLAMLGTIVGHEITHGFDTQGYEYDENGYHRMWWTEEDRVAFENRAAKLIRYYSSLTPVNRSAHMNGNTVSGEAIADMGGLSFALAVAEGIPDFDYDLFFRSYAALWRNHNTYIRETILMSDSHPLGLLRCNVTVSQFEQFQKTYDIQPGDGMYLAPEDRISVW